MGYTRYIIRNEEIVMNKYTVRKVTILLPMVILGIGALALVSFFDLVMVLNILVSFYVWASLISLVIGLVVWWYLLKVVAYMLDTLYGA